jgi:hypothetical protein
MAAALVWPLSNRLRRNPSGRLRIFEAQYLLAIVIGLVAGLTQELGYWRAKTGAPIQGFPASDAGK